MPDEMITKRRASSQDDFLLEDIPLDASATVGLEVAPPPRVSTTQTSFTQLADHAGHLRARVRLLSDDVKHLHQDVQLKEWGERSRSRAKQSVPELLLHLSGLGFAWRDIARMTGVSVPAVQKWRRGETASGDNRYRLAQICALCDLVADNHLVADVASWFEVPIVAEIPVAPLDLIAASREDLVIEHACGQLAPEDILDRFDADWHERYRSDFEVFVAPDDELSIRPKRER